MEFGLFSNGHRAHFSEERGLSFEDRHERERGYILDDLRPGVTRELSFQRSPERVAEVVLA